MHPRIQKTSELSPAVIGNINFNEMHKS